MLTAIPNSYQILVPDTEIPNSQHQRNQFPVLVQESKDTEQLQAEGQVTTACLVPGRRRKLWYLKEMSWRPSLSLGTMLSERAERAPVPVSFTGTLNPHTGDFGELGKIITRST